MVMEQALWVKVPERGAAGGTVRKAFKIKRREEAAYARNADTKKRMRPGIRAGKKPVRYAALF
ncbi:MAG: hypothetical protein V1913_15875 [Fibrobacterota bacterium]